MNVLGYLFLINEKQSNIVKKKIQHPRINITACFIALPKKVQSGILPMSAYKKGTNFINNIFHIIVKQVKFFPYLLQGMLAGIKVGIEAPSLQILPIFGY